MEIAIGTTSELKIRACKEALSKLGIENELFTIKAQSGVPDQPFGFEQITQGAKSRASEALKLTENADFSIGVENGLVKIDEIEQWFDIPCVYIITKDGDESYSFGSAYFVPDWMIDRIKKENTELGFIIQGLDSGAEKDPIGYFSSGKFKREEILTQAIVCALVKTIKKEKYNSL